MTGYTWFNDLAAVDIDELSTMYRLAPLGDWSPSALRTVFGNSMFTCFAYAGEDLAGAGRVLADGFDCAYIAHVAVHPAHQGRGLGTEIVRRLAGLARGHKKIILYANPGTEGFYTRLGFLRMNTAMAIWHDPVGAIGSGLLQGLTGQGELITHPSAAGRPAPGTGTAGRPGSAAASPRTASGE